MACGYGFTRDEKEAVIKAAIIAAHTNPGEPDSFRAIAAALPLWAKADPKTVAKNAQRMVSTGEILQWDSSTGLDGREQKARKPHPEFKKPPKLPENWRERYELLAGDAVDVLTAELKRRNGVPFTDCFAFSPAYYQCRDYGIDGQIGWGQTLDNYFAYFDRLAPIQLACLKDEGTAWLNIGDSYHDGSLLLVPSEIARIYRRKGWLVSAWITWRKTNPMPGGGRHRNRPTPDTEVILMMTKSTRNYYNNTHDLEPLAPGAKTTLRTSFRDTIIRPGEMPRRLPSKTVHLNPLGKNPGMVWSIPTKASQWRHLAPMPLKLARRLVRLGCPPGGLVCDCFGGAGTTGLAALVWDCYYLGIDLDLQNAKISAERFALNFDQRIKPCVKMTN